MTDVGFTGTQEGMTDAQKRTLAGHLSGYSPGAGFHHGDCIGADAQAHAAAYRQGLFVVLHPPLNSAKRAYCRAAQELPPLEYLARNHAIVDACGLLIAAPKSPVEELRSGTWATIRYARKKRVPVLIILPDGSVRT